jgi:hypothetical protein
VTAIRDLNAAGGADIAMRDLVNMGAMVGPRMFVSGTGLQSSANRPGVTDPAAEAGNQAKAVIDSGADWVKVFGSTGGFDNVTGEQTASYAEMKAIVDTAHAAGRKVAIHSYGPAGARDAIRAGATLSNTQPTWMTTLSRNWRGRRFDTFRVARRRVHPLVLTKRSHTSIDGGVARGGTSRLSGHQVRRLL